MAFTLARPAEWHEDIKKSRFLACAFPLTTVDGFLPLLETARMQAASHHCWAWKFGDAYRFSDDGEPTGTAGKPILTAIEGRGCDRVAIIVTRWFGGIELGTGGLARAYGGSAAHCLAAAELIEIIDWCTVSFHCPFHLTGMLEANLSHFHAVIEARSFDGQGSAVMLKLPQEQLQSFSHWLMDKSNGQAKIKLE